MSASGTPLREQVSKMVGEGEELNPVEVTNYAI